MNRDDFGKKIVILKEYVLKDVACYEYTCSRCGQVEHLPQVIAKTFNFLAPKNWCCVAQNNDRTYYCPVCGVAIGIGVHHRD